MEITQTLYVTSRDAWRAWLEKNSRSEADVWLIYYRKGTGKPRIPYNDAVEEALCFGWIDSIRKRLDEERSVQRFSPRKARTSYSQTNKERLRRLIKQEKVAPAVLESLVDVDLDHFEYPSDIMKALRENARAWRNLQKYSGAYQRIRIAYIESGRKRPGEFEKRLKRFIQKTAQDKQYGFGIEDYY